MSQKVYMYYETDGDAGYYAIKLFNSHEVAEAYKRQKNNAYGDISEMIIHDETILQGRKPYENLKCPLCQGDMVSRKGPYGSFWGCKKYPECKGTRDSEGLSREERRQEKERSDSYFSDSSEAARTFNDDLKDKKELNTVLDGVNKFKGRFSGTKEKS
jgi:ssDNA-binding Zn-finger/Zn-ribbon topoisomerase 1